MDAEIIAFLFSISELESFEWAAAQEPRLWFYGHVLVNFAILPTVIATGERLLVFYNGFFFYFQFTFMFKPQIHYWRIEFILFEHFSVAHR